MTTYARIENQTVIEVFVPHSGFALNECFCPEVVAMFVEVPDMVVVGSTTDDTGTWTPPAPPVAPGSGEDAPLELLTPMTFYLAFTPAERIEIKASKDPIVVEFWATYQLSVQLNRPVDPNLVSVRQALAYLAAPIDPGPGVGILASPERIAQILAGIPQ